MMKPMEYWAGWMHGWAAATKAILEGQQTVLRNVGALPEGAGEAAFDLPRQLMEEAARAAMPLAVSPDMAGSHPAAPRRRGRPPKSRPSKSRTAAAPAASEKRRRGRPSKTES